MSEHTPLPLQEGDESQELNSDISHPKFSRRRFLLGALGFGAAVFTGKKIFDVADQAPQKLQELQGYPEQWSDERLLTWFSGLEQEMNATHSASERYLVIQRVMNATLAFPEEVARLERAHEVRESVTEKFERVFDRPLTNNNADHYYGSLWDYGERLNRLYTLLTPERLVRFIQSEEVVALPSEKAAAHEHFIVHSFSALEGILGNNISHISGAEHAQNARAILQEILKQEPNFFQDLHSYYQVQVTKGVMGPKMVRYVDGYIAECKTLLK